MCWPIGDHFDNEAVENLREVVERTGTVVVIASSWRHMGLSRIQEIWREWNLPGEVIGCTPGEWGDAETFDTRGQEIQRWLEKNAVEPYRFVIIDDYGKEDSNSLFLGRGLAGGGHRFSLFGDVFRSYYDY